MEIDRKLQRDFANSNSLLNITWQIYNFAKSQNQMPNEKIGLFQQFAI
jgi:hypothetical protein